jgi:hypothetical protein
MKNTLALVAGGLLVLALGCGDDNKTTTPDSGTAGSGGKSSSTGGKGGGTGGSSTGTGGKGTGTGGGGGTVTEAQCETMANTNSGNMAPKGCVPCLCMKDAAKTAACGPGCWTLANCVGKKCMGDAKNVTCIQAMCATELMDSAGLVQSMAVPFAMCPTECGAVPPATDGGTDAGN